MKILIINDFTDKVGGAEVYCHRLADLLKENGHQVKFIGGKGGLARSKYRLFLSGWFNVHYYRLFSREIQKFKPDLIHARNFYNNISLSFLIAANRFKTPVIVHLSDFSSCICPRGVMVNWTGKPCEIGFSNKCITRCSQKEQLYDILRWLRLKSFRSMLRKYVDIFISPSKILADYMRRNLDVENVVVIPHFYPSPIEKTQRRMINDSEILFVGRLSKEKGIEYLIEAMPLVLKEIPDARLTIVGDGSMIKDLKDLSIKLQINENVIFKGHIPHEKVIRYYQSSSVLALPTVWFENFPNAVLEAMVHRLPVVTTNMGGQAELVEDGVTGYHVEPCNSKDLADKILLLIKNKELNNKMGENARQFAEKFTPEVHLKRLERIYNSLVKVR